MGGPGGVSVIPVAYPVAYSVAYPVAYSVAYPVAYLACCGISKI